MCTTSYLPHHIVLINISSSKVLCFLYRSRYTLFCFSGFYDIIAIVAGCVQTILYCDFFYLYITKVIKGKKLQLPA